MKNPIERTKNEFIKPFSSYVEHKGHENEESDEGKGNSNYSGNVNVSSFALCTTKH